MSSSVLFLFPKATQIDSTAPYTWLRIKSLVPFLVISLLCCIDLSTSLGWHGFRLPLHTAHFLLEDSTLTTSLMKKSRCFLITTESNWTHSPWWESYLAHRSLFSGSVGLPPKLNILQNRTFPKVSGIFPIFHDFSNSLPVALRLYLQFFFHTLDYNLSGPRGLKSFLMPRFFLIP